MKFRLTLVGIKLIAVLGSLTHSLSASAVETPDAAEPPTKVSNPVVVGENVTINVQGDRISLTSENADLPHLLAAISDATGIQVSSVYDHPEGLGGVTVEFENRTIDDALSLIVEKIPTGGYAIVNKPVGKRIYFFRRGESKNKRVLSSTEDNKSDPGAPETNSAYLLPESEKDVLWLKNHMALLSVIKEYREFIRAIRDENVGSGAEVPVFEQWAKVLYEDAVLAEYLADSTSEERRVELSLLVGQIPDEYDISLLASVIPSTSKYYPDALKKILQYTQNNYSEDIELAEAKVMADKFLDLVQKRKSYSDNLYKTEMKYVLRDASVSVSKKVEYVQPYLKNQDWRLVNYGLTYFKELAEHETLTQDENALVSKFVTSATDKATEK